MADAGLLAFAGMGENRFQDLSDAAKASYRQAYSAYQTAQSAPAYAPAPEPAPAPAPTSTALAPSVAAPTSFTAPDGTIVNIGAPDVPAMPRTYTPLPDTYVPPLTAAMIPQFGMTPPAPTGTPQVSTSPLAPTLDNPLVPKPRGGGGTKNRTATGGMLASSTPQVSPTMASAPPDPYAVQPRLTQSLQTSTNPFLFVDQEKYR